MGTIRTVLIFLTARITRTCLTIQVVTKDSGSQDYCELCTSTLHNEYFVIIVDEAQIKAIGKEATIEIIVRIQPFDFVEPLRKFSKTIKRNP